MISDSTAGLREKIRSYNLWRRALFGIYTIQPAVHLEQANNFINSGLIIDIERYSHSKLPIVSYTYLFSIFC
jgi:hypothetical protein